MQSSVRAAAPAFLRASRAIFLQFILLGFCAVSPALGSPLQQSEAAATNSPIGYWKTFDDKTGAVRAIVQIYEQEGKLFGKIAQSFTPGAESRVCGACTDERKNQPIIGLVLIRNMQASGDEFTGGDILDPDNGSIYRCKFHVEQNGTRLVLRGYIGFSLLGRTQTWQRQESL